MVLLIDQVVIGLGVHRVQVVTEQVGPEGHLSPSQQHGTAVHIQLFQLLHFLGVSHFLFDEEQSLLDGQLELLQEHQGLFLNGDQVGSLQGKDVVELTQGSQQVTQGAIPDRVLFVIFHLIHQGLEDVIGQFSELGEHFRFQRPLHPQHLLFLDPFDQ